MLVPDPCSLCCCLLQGCHIQNEHQLSQLFFPLTLQHIFLPTSSEAEKPEVTCLTTCFLCLSFLSPLFPCSFPRTGRMFSYFPFLNRRGFSYIISSSYKARRHSFHIIANSCRGMWCAEEGPKRMSTHWSNIFKIQSPLLHNINVTS